MDDVSGGSVNEGATSRNGSGASTVLARTARCITVSPLRKPRCVAIASRTMSCCDRPLRAAASRSAAARSSLSRRFVLTPTVARLLAAEQRQALS